MTLKQYLKHFSNIYGALIGLFSGFPLLALLGSPFSGFLFPPLGEFTPYAIALTVLFIVITILLMYFIRDYAIICDNVKRMRLFLVLVAVMVLSIAGFLTLHTVFVYNHVDAVADKKTPVSIGFTRTEKFHDSLKVVDALQTSGPEDDQIRYYWTPFSVAVARASLFLSYLLFLLPGIALFSTMILTDLFERRRKPEMPRQ